MTITRRNLLQQAAALAFAQSLKGLPQESSTKPSSFVSLDRPPDSVWVFTESAALRMSHAGESKGQEWTAEDVQLSLSAPTPSQGVTVRVRAERSALLRCHLRWEAKPPAALRYLGDQWERSYGDLGWRSLDPDRILPWYFLATDGRTTTAYGVKTGAGAFCFWQIDDAGLNLWLDFRNGGRGVLLNGRELEAATLLSETYEDRSFMAASRFCKRLCDRPRMPAQPVYGGNNWYFAYGKSSAADILRDSATIAFFASDSGNPPFMVIDDGWAPNATAGPWSRGNDHFPDMALLAADMKARGVRPGIWIRPLFTQENVPDTWRLRTPTARRAGNPGLTLDPTVPDALAHIRADFATLSGWGYELIKHDFSTFDLLGRWGFQMGAALTEDGWNFQDRGRTNAEILRALYEELHDAAPGALSLGCNTVGHLGAGIFEMQRTGDDTSGRDFNRTRKMGVNTLAFRAPQHGAFFAIDADCVGITREIPWELNRQWLDLLAYSGTPLFVSPAPDALGPEQTRALQRAFAAAAKPQPLGEPLDWMDTTEPTRWRLNGKPAAFDWVGPAGASPFTR